jgi:hypothetical protein
MKIKAHHIQQGAVTALLLALIAVLESKAAIGAYHSVLHEEFVWTPFGQAPLAAVQHASLSVVCSLLSFFGFGLAGRLKDDIRPYVRRRALPLRCIALALLLVPIGYLGSSFKMDRERAEWNAYVTSPAYDRDVELASDLESDPYESAAAAERIVPPTNAQLDIVQFEWWLAAFFQFALIFASDAMRVPAPVTEDEVKHWRSVAAGKKGAATRKANAEKRRKKAAQKNVVPLFSRKAKA